MAPVSLKKTIQSYKAVAQQLETKLDQLTQKRNEIESRGFVVLDEHSVDLHSTRQVDLARVERPLRHTTTAVPLQQRTTPTLLIEELETQYPSNVSSLVATATNILIESVSLRLSFVQESIKKLTVLYHENQKLPTPPELLFSRYEEWVLTNQKLFELNTRLYDLEKLKFDLKEKKRLAKKAIKKLKTEVDKNITGSQFVQSSVERVQSFLARFHQHSPSFSNTTQLFLQELLSPRGERQTLEATKIQEYVNECLQAASRSDGAWTTGAHPECYHQFIEVLCNYIVERQRDIQGVELAHEMVYSTVERFLVPKIQSAILKHVAIPERDAAIQKQCERFRDVTLQQLGVKASFVSYEVVPFIESISQLRASYFSPTPTDKMYSVVEAARALYEQLNSMGESSIDGDSFLDLWIYVIIKANVKDLATNLQLMTQYGNQRLAKDEVGYYLTTLEAAVAYVENLSPENLKVPQSTQHFVVCERYKFQHLSRLSSSCFEVVTERSELHGYKMVTIKKWALNRARVYSTVLAPTGDSKDIAVVAVIRLISDRLDTTHLEYFNQRFLHPEEDYTPLHCQQTPLGIAVVINPSKIDPHEVIILPNGDFETHYTKLNHVLHLIRLGSETREMTCTTAEIEASSSEQHKGKSNDGYIYVYTPPNDPVAHLDSIRSTNSQPPSSTKSKSIVSTKRRTASARDEPGDILLSGSPYLFSYSMETRPPEAPTPKVSENRSRKRNWSLNLRKKVPKEEKEEEEYAPARLVASQHPYSNSATYWTQPELYDVYSPNGQHHRDHGCETEIGYEPPNVVQVQVEVHDFDDNSQHEYPMNKSSERRGAASSKREFDMKSFVEDSGNHLSPHDSNINLQLSTENHSNESTSLSNSKMSNITSVSPVSDEGAVGEEGNVLCSLPSGLELGVDDGVLSEKCIANLETNFRKNHLVGDGSKCLDEKMSVVIKQAQMFLQRLNYLSFSSPIDGLYSDITLDAVKRFQISHNVYGSHSTVNLPTNGYLMAATFQYLRQAFLTVFASLMRVGLDKHLAESFNPMSTSDKDIGAFTESVILFQDANNLTGLCQEGVVCAATIDRVRHILCTQRYTL